jgi:hypothetical protein
MPKFGLPMCGLAQKIVPQLVGYQIAGQPLKSWQVFTLPNVHWICDVLTKHMYFPCKNLLTFYKPLDSQIFYKHVLG